MLFDFCSENYGALNIETMANEIKTQSSCYCLFDFCVLALCGCGRPSFGPKNCVCLSAVSHCFFGFSDAEE